MQPRISLIHIGKSTALIPQNPITIFSPASSKTDSPHSPTSRHYPPTSSAADQAPSSPSAHTSANESWPPPPLAGTPDYEHRILNWAVSARTAARTNNSSTRQLVGLGVPSGEAVIEVCRIPAVRRGGRLGLAVVGRRSLSLVSRARLVWLDAVAADGMVGSLGSGRIVGVGGGRWLNVGARRLGVVRRSLLGRQAVRLCMD